MSAKYIYRERATGRLVGSSSYQSQLGGRAGIDQTMLRLELRQHALLSEIKALAAERDAAAASVSDALKSARGQESGASRTSMLSIGIAAADVARGLQDEISSRYAVFQAVERELAQLRALPGLAELGAALRDW